MASPDNSIKTVNRNIVNLLEAAAEPGGLHADVIVQKLGYQAKSDIAPRLRDLRGRGEIEEVTKDRWRKKEKKKSSVNSAGDGQPIIIHLPGDEKFTSYKNSLQEYCQKKGLSVPNYQAIHENHGYIGTVTFSETCVRTRSLCGDHKEADTQAAIEALQQLGYLNSEGLASSNIVRKRKSDTNHDVPTQASKQIKVLNSESVTFKSKLNDYCQKQRLPTPKYETVPVSGGFFSTVDVDNRNYKSMATCTKRKDAEQSAAQVALNALIGITSSDLMRREIGEDDVAKMISEARQASQLQPGEFKSRLQEVCRKLDKEGPAYETIMPGEQTFQSTVTIDDIRYTGPYANRKKIAEGRAAELALKAFESVIM